MCFDGELHRKFVHYLFGVAVDDESDGIFDANTPLPAVEELVVADLGGGGLVLDGSRGIGDDHIREGVCAASVAEKQGVALAVVAGIVGVDTHLDESAVGVLAVSGGYTFRNNTRARVTADMDHLGTRVRWLVIIGDGHRVEFGRGVVASQDA